MCSQIRRWARVCNLVGTQEGWRRIAHKVADQVYSRITGETGYFDSRVVYVSESGPKGTACQKIGNYGL